jgi:hypothetical protein
MEQSYDYWPTARQQIANGERHQMMLGKHPNLLGVDQEILRLPACFRLFKPKKMMATKAVAVQIWW